MANIRGQQYVLHNPSPEQSGGEDDDEEYETQKNLSKFFAKLRRKSTADTVKSTETDITDEKRFSNV